MNIIRKGKAIMHMVIRHPKIAVIMTMIWGASFYFQPLILEHISILIEKVTDNEGLTKYKSFQSHNGHDSHYDDIGSLFVNGSLLITAGDDDFLKIWDYRKGTLNYSLRYHSNDIQVVVMYGDQYIISGGNDSIIVIADINKDEIYKLRGHTSSVYSLIAKDGKLYSSSSNGEIIIWDILSHEIEHRAKISNKAIYSLAISNDYLLAATEDKMISILNRSTLSQVGKLKGHRKSVKTIVSYGNDMLVSSGKDKHLIGWNLNTSRIVFDITLDFRVGMNEIFVYDRQMFIASGQSNKILMFDLSESYIVKSKKPSKVFIGAHDHESIFVKNGCLYAGSTEGTIEVWNINKDTQPIAEIKGINIPQKLTACH